MPPSQFEECRCFVIFGGGRGGSRQVSEAWRLPRPARQLLAGRRRRLRPLRRALVSRARQALGVGRWTRMSCEHSHVIHRITCCMPQRDLRTCMCTLFASQYRSGSHHVHCTCSLADRFVERQSHAHHRYVGLAYRVPHRLDDGRLLSRAYARPAQFDDTPELSATISPGDSQNRHPCQHSLQHRFVRVPPHPSFALICLVWRGASRVRPTWAAAIRPASAPTLLGPVFVFIEGTDSGRAGAESSTPLWGTPAKAPGPCRAF
jgi:hypothetical protein